MGITAPPLSFIGFELMLGPMRASPSGSSRLPKEFRRRYIDPTVQGIEVSGNGGSNDDSGCKFVTAQVPTQESALD